MTTVKQLLQTKGSDVWTITPDVSIQDALTQMDDKNVGALLVIEAEKLVGIISERDYARMSVRKEGFSMSTPVREIMTTRVYTMLLGVLQHQTRLALKKDFAVDETKANWHHSLQVMSLIESNRRSFRRFLQAYCRGDKDYLPNHAASREWVNRHPAIDFKVWSQGITRAEKHPLGRLAVHRVRFGQRGGNRQ